MSFFRDRPGIVGEVDSFGSNDINIPICNCAANPTEGSLVVLGIDEEIPEYVLNE